MNRRTRAGLLAVALIITFVVYGAVAKVPYVTFRPGPTFDVLGKIDGRDGIKITGHKVYRDEGQLRMVTVIPSGPEQKVNLFRLVLSWADPDVDVFPKEAIYGKGSTDASVREESVAQMSGSQGSAVAAALAAANIDFRTRTLVTTVLKDGPSAGLLKKDDQVLAVDGFRSEDSDELVERIRAVEPGTTVTVTVRRAGAEKDVPIRTVAAEDDAESARIGINVGTDYVFPFDVKIQIPESVGGPSAGMIFALTIYDLITPGSLTGGLPIAGTGEITAEGVIGPIGGVDQKIVSAQRDGAKVFLVPQENCEEAEGAHFDRDKIRLVKVHTLAQAIDDLEKLAKDPDVVLPRCG
jgi:PDZ domain-containing protein